MITTLSIRHRKTFASILIELGENIVTRVQEESAKLEGHDERTAKKHTMERGKCKQTQLVALFTSIDALELISWSVDCSTPVVCTNLLSFPFRRVNLIRFSFCYLLQERRERE